MKNRLVAIDILRVFSLFLVVYAHLVYVPAMVDQIPRILPDNANLPIFSIERSHWLLAQDGFLNAYLHTYSGPLGVILFFIITGYLMGHMMERYNRTKFLVNRFFRIFPVLFAILPLTGCWLYFTQGITFSGTQYVTSATLTYTLIGVAPIIGVLWTLVIEMLFYFITTAIGKFTLRKLLWVQFALLILVLSAKATEAGTWLWAIAWNAKYLMVVALGGFVFLAEKGRGSLWIAALAWLMAYIALDSHGGASYGARPTLISLVIVILAIRWGERFEIKSNRLIRELSDMVYPMYLIHVPFGIVTVYSVFQATGLILLSIASGLIVSILVSKVIVLIIEKPFIKVGRRVISATRLQPYLSSSHV